MPKKNPLFKPWCATSKEATGKKILLTVKERQGGRAAASLPGIVRSHYDALKRIADDVADRLDQGCKNPLRAHASDASSPVGRIRGDPTFA